MCQITNEELGMPRRVALIFGGVSTEHEVSILSASQVVEGLKGIQPALEIRLVYITPDGTWAWGPRSDNGRTPGKVDVLAAKNWASGSGEQEAPTLVFSDALVRLKREGIEAALLILHGQNGEDGRLQGALDLAGIPYTGSGAAASALAFDKPRCQAVLRAAGLPVAPALSLRAAGDESVRKIIERIGLPCVIKPARGGSSVGVTIVREAGQLPEALEQALQADTDVMAERFIEGREFTCGLLELDGELVALPVTEIIPPDGRFFDYEAKYTAGVSREVTPANIPETLAGKIQALARAVHLTCDCRGFSRVDFIADPGEPMILEINTIPGMTATSLLPQAAAVRGISFTELLKLMLGAARHD